MLGFWSLGQQSLGVIAEYAENTAHLRGGAVADDPRELGQQERERLRARYEQRKRRKSPPAAPVPVIITDYEHLLPELPGLDPLPPHRPDLAPLYSPPLVGDVFEIDDTAAMTLAAEAADEVWDDDRQADEAAALALQEQIAMDQEALAAASRAMMDDDEAELLAKLVTLGVV